MERKKDLDILKGFAILCVVLGHVICLVYDKNNYTNNLIFRFCYSFHMPLFFTISGYLDGKKDINNLWVEKKIDRLFRPWLIWTCIEVISGILFNYSFESVFKSTPLWFLINLFLFNIILYICIRNKVSLKINLAGTIILFVFLYSILKIDILKNTILFYPFYIFGYTINQKNINYRYKANQYALLGSVLYIVSMFFYTYGIPEARQFILEFSGRINTITESCLIILLILYSRFIVAVLGMIFVYNLISRIKIVHNILNYIGQYTMVIYILSSYFFLYNTSSVLLTSGISFLLGITMPIIISNMLNDKIRKVLF